MHFGIGTRSIIVNARAMFIDSLSGKLRAAGQKPGTYDDTIMLRGPLGLHIRNHNLSYESKIY